jgi:hypothetical protein
MLFLLSKASEDEADINLSGQNHDELHDLLSTGKQNQWLPINVAV